VLYGTYAIFMVLVSTYRRALSNREFFTDGHGKYFQTSGRIVAVTLMLSIGMYTTLLVLLWRI
jgi:hypothetical protein